MQFGPIFDPFRMTHSLSKHYNLDLCYNLQLRYYGQAPSLLRHYNLGLQLQPTTNIMLIIRLSVMFFNAQAGNSNIDSWITLCCFIRSQRRVVIQKTKQFKWLLLLMVTRVYRIDNQMFQYFMRMSRFSLFFLAGLMNVNVRLCR